MTLHDCGIEFLSCEAVIEAHDSLIERFGGLPGIRDEALLLSGLSRAEFYFYYQEFDIPSLAAVYLHSINAGHVFVDGNKRTSAAAAEAFLFLNGYQLKASNDELEEVVLAVANSCMTLEELCEFFCCSRRAGQA